MLPSLDNKKPSFDTSLDNDKRKFRTKTTFINKEESDGEKNQGKN
jgi:hypothetical protein